MSERDMEINIRRPEWYRHKNPEKMIERDIENYLVRRVKEAGGEVRKVAWVGKRNAPDRFVMLPLRATQALTNNCVWVELKAPGKTPRLGQHREHERMRRFGQRVVVIDSFQQVDELLK